MRLAIDIMHTLRKLPEPSRHLACLAALSLISCNQKNFSAQECEALANPKAFVDRCMGGKLNGNYVGDLNCWPFSTPERLRGVWVGRMEASEFYPNATTFEQVENAKPRIWLQLDPKAPTPALTEGAPSGHVRAYLIDAKGRLSLCDAWFGHQAQYPREFIVDRFYSVQPLPVH